jgi:hypothetical protein
VRSAFAMGMTGLIGKPPCCGLRCEPLRAAVLGSLDYPPFE